MKLSDKCEVLGCGKTSRDGLRLLRGELIIIPMPEYDAKDSSWWAFEPGIALCSEHMELVCRAVQQVMGREVTSISPKELKKIKKGLTCQACFWCQREGACFGPDTNKCPPDDQFRFFVPR